MARIVALLAVVVAVASLAFEAEGGMSSAGSNPFLRDFPTARTDGDRCRYPGEHCAVPSQCCNRRCSFYVGHCAEDPPSYPNWEIPHHNPTWTTKPRL